jgi:diaminohydroxyphosphoribosylaminopyrimidine deaminase / 5-amino-6-(5-phosphoribosylamino)uracil reductase
MALAIELAMRGRGSVEPNPMVGCVIVRGDRAIGRGYHGVYGGAHAEPEALADCIEPPAGAMAYVNLEPCCHRNKKTPPCAPALIAAGLARVVVGCTDPNPPVAGKGIEQLRAAGIEVELGILEAEAKQLNAAYFAGVLHRRPYVTLKWAESADGKVAGPSGRRVTISNSASLAVIHGLRARCDAIMVGIGTVLNDDPILTARGVESPRKLLRVVLDAKSRMPGECRLASTPDQGPVIVYGAEKSPGIAGVEFVAVPCGEGRASLRDVLVDLHKRGVTHLLVEPGPTLAKSFLASDLVDRIWRFQSSKKIEDRTAPAAQPVDFPATAQVKLDGDSLTEYLNPGSDVFFAMAASADIVPLMIKANS